VPGDGHAGFGRRSGETHRVVTPAGRPGSTSPALHQPLSATHRVGTPARHHQPATINHGRITPVSTSQGEVQAERLEGEQHPDGRPLRVWLDLLDIDPGQSIVGRVNTGLATAQHVGLLLTPDYLQSPSGWTDAEWQAALFDDPAGRSSRVVPLLLESCPELPPLLRHLYMIDLRGPAYEAGYQQLVRFLRGETSRAHRFRGQLIRSDGRISAETLAAERALEAAAPDRVEEHLLGNLLPVLELPRRVWMAPIARTLARGAGAHRTYPTKERLRQLIRD
jgi:hypothetical protein